MLILQRSQRNTLVPAQDRSGTAEGESRAVHPFKARLLPLAALTPKKKTLPSFIISTPSPPLSHHVCHRDDSLTRRVQPVLYPQLWRQGVGNEDWGESMFTQTAEVPQCSPLLAKCKKSPRPPCGSCPHQCHLPEPLTLHTLAPWRILSPPFVLMGARVWPPQPGSRESSENGTGS